MHLEQFCHSWDVFATEVFSSIYIPEKLPDS